MVMSKSKRSAEEDREDKPASTVKVLESGIVGTLDYKIVSAEKASDLYDWLKEHKYSFSGDEANASTESTACWP